MSSTHLSDILDDEKTKDLDAGNGAFVPKITQSHHDPGDNDGESSLEEECLLNTRSVTFAVSTGKKPRLIKSSRLNNIAPTAIGFLDLANSGDFAANVFNEIPVPIYATVLMVIGATCALLMSYISFRDAIRSWKNICILRQERHMLLSQAGDESVTAAVPKHLVSAELDLNYRDLSTEIFDRGGMEVMMGTAAFLIAVGTYMAPAGANVHVYHASNLLSGYIGNAPAAAYGLITAIWSIQVWQGSQRQSRAARLELLEGRVLRALESRLAIVRIHALISGVVCLVSGILSMFTPTRWWPYPILLVCGIAFRYMNYIFRTRIGYERSQLETGTKLEKHELLRELAWLSSMCRILKPRSCRLEDITGLSQLSVPAVVALVVRCDLFEPYSMQLMHDPSIVAVFAPGGNGQVHLDPEMLLALPRQHHEKVSQIARDLLEKRGLNQLSLRKRFLLEARPPVWRCPSLHTYLVMMNAKSN